MKLAFALTMNLKVRGGWRLVNVLMVVLVHPSIPRTWALCSTGPCKCPPPIKPAGFHLGQGETLQEQCYTPTPTGDQKSINEYKLLDCKCGSSHP